MNNINNWTPTNIEKKIIIQWVETQISMRISEITLRHVIIGWYTDFLIKICNEWLLYTDFKKSISDKIWSLIMSWDSTHKKIPFVLFYIKRLLTNTDFCDYAFIELKETLIIWLKNIISNQWRKYTRHDIVAKKLLNDIYWITESDIIAEEVKEEAGKLLNQSENEVDWLSPIAQLSKICPSIKSGKEALSDWYSTITGYFKNKSKFINNIYSLLLEYNRDLLINNCLIWPNNIVYGNSTVLKLIDIYIKSISKPVINIDKYMKSQSLSEEQAKNKLYTIVDGIIMESKLIPIRWKINIFSVNPELF